MKEIINRRELLKASAASAISLTSLTGGKSSGKVFAAAKPKYHKRNVQSKSQRLKAGASVRIVNPFAPAVPIGHLSTTACSKNHTDIRVQAMVVEDMAGNRLVWMGWDFCNVIDTVADRIKETVQEKYGIAPEAFCINASHTHSAPALLEREALEPAHFDPKYAEFVIKQAVEVVGEAIGKLTHVRLRYTEYMCTSVGINRRLKVEDKVRSLPNLKGDVDHRVQVITAESVSDGKLLSVVVKYACHSVAVGPTSLGGDYPGFMREFVEQRHPGAIAIFLQGCGGDVRIQAVNNDVTEFVIESVEFGQRFGRDLGMAVEWSLNEPATIINGPIETAYTTIDLPLENLFGSEYNQWLKEHEYLTKRWKEKFSTMLARGESIPTVQPYRLQMFRLGAKSENPLNLVALQGEVFTAYGFNIEKILQPARTIVLGYSNHMAGYVCTAEAIKQGGYEPSAFPFWLTPGSYTTQAEPMILEAVRKLAKI